MKDKVGTLDQGRLLARALRALAAALERASEKELSALTSGRAEIGVRIQVQDAISGKLRAERGRPSLDLFDPEAVKAQLISLSSREEGARIISEQHLTRKEMEMLARVAGAVITKNDNMERIQEKIIENCIGSRLSSIAIRGNS